MNQYAKRPRRRYSPQQKREMVELALNADDSIAAVAQRLGINQNQLSRWITEYRRDDAWAALARATWLPVVLEDNVPADTDKGLPHAELALSEPAEPLDNERHHESRERDVAPVARIRIGSSILLELSSPTPALLKSLVEALQ